MKKDYQNRSGEYEKSYGSSSYNKDERASFARRKADAAPSDAKRREVPPTPPTEGKQKRRSLAKHPFFIWLLLVLISTAFTWIMEDESPDAEEQTEETFDDPWSSDDMDLEENLEEDIEPVRDDAGDATNDVSVQPESEIELSAIGSMDSEAFAPTEKDETVSDDNLSTLDALERRNHADVVKQAERAGVSTEGSTLEILERINHAEVVKQAERAGVSAEGSTSEILERINHAEVVKQAERAGVSAEGSTLEILERISRKEMENMKR